MTADEVNRHILDNVRILATLPYDATRSRLPLREDAARWISAHLCGAQHLVQGPPVLRAEGCDPPEVTLERDGTVKIEFADNLRTLTFRVLCPGVVTVVQDFGGASRIDRTLPGVHGDDAHQVAYLFAWLREEDWT